MPKATIARVICSILCTGVIWLNASDAQEWESAHPALSQAVAAAEDRDYERAARFLAVARAEGVPADVINEANVHIGRLRESTLARSKELFQQALDEGDIERAQAMLIDLVALGLDSATVARFRLEITNISEYGSYRPKQLFSDPILGASKRGPMLLVVPQGRFMMGSTDNERYRESHEGPRHRVTVQDGFAMGMYEVSVGEFAIFFEATGHQTDAERKGYSQVYEPRTGRMIRRRGVNWRHDYLGEDALTTAPVIHVSWRDANAYVRWLSEVTNERYRLPSEAEFEYVLRAESQSVYPWGDEHPTEAVENLAGDGDESPNGARWTLAFKNFTDGYWGPAPVGQLLPNSWGFYDLNGNVMEWTEDCWHDSYVRAPTTTMAWVNRGCEERVIRGGSWAATPKSSRSAFRDRLSEEGTDSRVGFRVVRELSHD